MSLDDNPNVIRVRARVDAWASYQRGRPEGPAGYPRQSASQAIEPATAKRNPTKRALDGKRYAVMPSDLAALTPARGKSSGPVHYRERLLWPAEVEETNKAIASLDAEWRNAIISKWLHHGPHQAWRERYQQLQRLRHAPSRTAFDDRVKQALCMLIGTGI